jgi:hypothetical protein
MRLLELHGRKAGEELPHQRHLRRRTLVFEKPRHRQAERLGHPAQQRDGDVSLPRLDLGDVALGHAGVVRQQLAAHAAPCARGANTLAERVQKGVVGVGHERGGL